MTMPLEPVPTFSSEAEERAYWESHDSSESLDWSKAERVRLPNLKSASRATSLHLPMPLLERIKIAADKQDVPYQSLIEMWLTEKLDSGSR